MAVAKEIQPLTPQESLFVEAYIEDPSNITRAAIKAGFPVDTARKKGTQILEHPKAQKMITDAQKQAANALGITVARIAAEYWKIAGANPGDVVTVDAFGEASIDPTKAAELAVSTTSDGSPEGKKVKSVVAKTIKPSDKINALEKVTKILGLMPKEEIEVVGKLTLADLISQSYKDDVIDTEVSEPTEVPLLTNREAVG